MAERYLFSHMDRFVLAGPPHPPAVDPYTAFIYFHDLQIDVTREHIIAYMDPIQPLSIIFDGAGAHVELRHLREMIATINKHSLLLDAFPHVTANYIPNITRLIHDYMHDT